MVNISEGLARQLKPFGIGVNASRGRRVCREGIFITAILRNSPSSLAEARRVTKPNSIVVVMPEAIHTIWKPPRSSPHCGRFYRICVRARTALAATVRTYNVARGTISRLTVPDETTALAVQ